jgi:hypothetical protein
MLNARPRYGNPRPDNSGRTALESSKTFGEGKP